MVPISCKHGGHEIEVDGFGMVDDLLRALGKFKANMEYRNVDFNADKTSNMKQ